MYWCSARSRPSLYCRLKGFGQLRYLGNRQPSAKTRAVLRRPGASNRKVWSGLVQYLENSSKAQAYKHFLVGGTVGSHFIQMQRYSTQAKRYHFLTINAVSANLVIRLENHASAVLLGTLPVFWQCWRTVVDQDLCGTKSRCRYKRSLVTIR